MCVSFVVFNVIITFKPKSRFHSVKAFSLFANFYHKRVAKCQTQSLKISRNDAREYVVSIAHWYNLSSVPSDLGLQLYSLGLWPKVPSLIIPNDSENLFLTYSFPSSPWQGPYIKKPKLLRLSSTHYFSILFKSHHHASLGST